MVSRIQSCQRQLRSLILSSSSASTCLRHSNPKLRQQLSLQARVPWSNTHARRTHTHAHNLRSQEQPLLGDEPPLYDGKPRWWSRWAWGLLAVDILFTASTIDITMRYWSQPVEQSQATANQSTPTDSPKEYELRPLYQRLLLSAAQLVAGALAGGLIMASRDRTVWKMQLKRLPLLVTPKSKPGPATSRTTTTPHVHKHKRTDVPSQPAPAALTLSTASGRSKKFLLRDCVLAPGRDATEMILKIHGMRGSWWVGLNGAKVLGVDEAEIVKSLAESQTQAQSPTRAQSDTSNDVNTETATAPPVIVDTREQGLAALGEMRERMIKAWLAAGGNVASLQRPRPETPDKGVGGWTGGPVVRG